VQEGLDRFFLIQRPEPGRSIVAPGQNPALVAVEDRTIDRFLVRESLDRFLLIQRP
jgi:hypothetical protein